VTDCDHTGGALQGIPQILEDTASRPGIASRDVPVGLAQVGHGWRREDGRRSTRAWLVDEDLVDDRITVHTLTTIERDEPSRELGPKLVHPQPTELVAILQDEEPILIVGTEVQVF